MPRVLISVHVTDEQVARLRAASPDVDIVSAPGGIALRPPSPLDLMEPTCPVYHPDLDLPALLADIDAIVAFALTPELHQQAPTCAGCRSSTPASTASGSPTWPTQLSPSPR
jgi:hypothetical protein